MGKLSAADRKALQAEEAKQQSLKKAEYAATLPMKLLVLMARAQARSDVSYAVHNPDGGFMHVVFSFNSVGYCPDGSHNSSHDGSNDPDVHQVYLTSDEWEVQRVENEFSEREAADLERERLLKVARDAYDSLSEEQRTALKVRRPY